jgi:hypothetical protein
VAIPIIPNISRLNSIATKVHLFGLNEPITIMNLANLLRFHLRTGRLRP